MLAHKKLTDFWLLRSLNSPGDKNSAATDRPNPNWRCVQKWWTRWTPHEVNVKTQLDAMSHCIMQISQYRRYESCDFWATSLDAVMTANQCWDSLDVTDSLTARTLPEFTERTLNQTWRWKQLLLCVNTWSSYDRTLYTTGLSNEHRHGIVKFSNMTSTTDAVRRGWFSRPWLMTESRPFSWRY